MYVGEYTLSIVGGGYLTRKGRRAEGRTPPARTPSTAARSTFTDRYDLRWFGTSWTGRWMLEAMELSFNPHAQVEVCVRFATGHRHTVCLAVCHRNSLDPANG